MANVTDSQRTAYVALRRSLRRQGFDVSRFHVRDDGSIGARLGCSQCQPLSICGVPTHESGCPRGRRRTRRRN